MNHTWLTSQQSELQVKLASCSVAHSASRTQKVQQTSIICLPVPALLSLLTKVHAKASHLHPHSQSLTSMNYMHASESKLTLFQLH